MSQVVRCKKALKWHGFRSLHAPELTERDLPHAARRLEVCNLISSDNDFVSFYTTSCFFFLEDTLQLVLRQYIRGDIDGRFSSLLFNRAERHYRIQISEQEKQGLLICRGYDGVFLLQRSITYCKGTS